LQTENVPLAYEERKSADLMRNSMRSEAIHYQVSICS
jgi:hypothetical protein